MPAPADRTETSTMTTDVPQDPASPPPPAPRLAVITCAVLEDEIRCFAARSAAVMHVQIIEQGLHNDPPQLRQRLQQAVDHVERTTDADAIVLGYGLCSRGIEGVVTRRCRLVVTRAHDCITLLLGSRRRYAEYVAAHPGTYWYSPGWSRCHIPPGPQRYEKLREQYIGRYGADNAEFLMETETQWMKTYSRATYVDLTVGATDADVQYTRDCADWLGWSFDRVRGDPALLQALLCGRWNDEDFLVLEPGQSLRMTADDRVIEAVPATDLTPQPDRT
jgi:hypothetical protein